MDVKIKEESTDNSNSLNNNIVDDELEIKPFASNQNSVTDSKFSESEKDKTFIKNVPEIKMERENSDDDDGENYLTTFGPEIKPEISEMYIKTEFFYPEVELISDPSIEHDRDKSDETEPLKLPTENFFEHSLLRSMLLNIVPNAKNTQAYLPILNKKPIIKQPTNSGQTLKKLENSNENGSEKYRKICTDCNKGFKNNYLLNKHKLLHTEGKTHVCNICNKSFGEKHHLNQHKVIHTGQKPHVCQICDRAFTKKSQLNCHLVTHTDNTPYACDVCDKKFKLKQNLNTHRRLHTGEKPYICDICGKDFASKSNLNEHRKLHTGQKPFKCDQCYRTFNTKSNLNKHKLIHSDVKLYSCQVCHKEFSQKQNLVRHKAFHNH